MIATKNQNIAKWSSENAYDNDAHLDSYPRRLFNARIDSGLAFLVRCDDQNACFYQSSGFRLYLSSIGEAPIMSRKHFFINPNEDVQITLKPTLVSN